MAQYTTVPLKAEPFVSEKPLLSSPGLASLHPSEFSSTSVNAVPNEAYYSYNPSIQQPPSAVPPRKRGLWTRIQALITRLWLLEVLASFVAVAVHIGLIALLRAYDNAPVFSWAYPWALNSTIAFMTTIIKGAALTPIAGAIGQLKWRRFWEYRKLRDMEKFDEGTRGTLGAMKLLLHLRFWHFASFGAIVTIVALSLATLAQSVLQTYYKSDIIPGLSTIPRVNGYDTFTTYLSGDTPGDQLPWPTMVSAINYGMSYTASFFGDQSSILPFNCDTGNCTFGTYQSLMVLTQCLDTTDLIDSTDPDFWVVPEGPVLPKQDGILNISSSTEYPSSLDGFKDIGPLILNFQAISRDNVKQDVNPTAIQCLLYWGVGTYAASNVTDGALYDDATSTFTNTTQAARTTYNQTETITIMPPDCWVNGTQVAEPNTDDNCMYSVGSLAQLGLQNFLADTGIGMQGEVLAAGDQWSVSNLFGNALSYSIRQVPPNETSAQMVLTVNNTVAMMTQGVRQLPVGVNNTYAPASGTVELWEGYYTVQYRFLVAHHFVVGGSLIFLMMTIYLTRTDYPWKNSSLALLFHGLTPEDRSRAAELSQLVDMRQAADEMVVKTCMTEMGSRLSSRGAVAAG